MFEIDLDKIEQYIPTFSAWESITCTGKFGKAPIDKK